MALVAASSTQSTTSSISLALGAVLAQVVAQALAGAQQVGGLRGDAEVQARWRGLRRLAGTGQLAPGGRREGRTTPILLSPMQALSPLLTGTAMVDLGQRTTRLRWTRSSAGRGPGAANRPLDGGWLHRCRSCTREQRRCLRLTGGKVPTISGGVGLRTVRDLRGGMSDGTSGELCVHGAGVTLGEGRTIGALAVAIDISAERRNHLFNRTLARINGAITSRDSFDEIMNLAVRETVQAVGAESGVVYVSEKEGWAARWVYGLPESVRGKRFVDEEVYYSVLAVQGGGQTVINDPDADARVHSGLIADYGIKAILDVPLVVGENLIGDFCIHHHDGRKFTEEEAEFARNVASSMSLALRNAKTLSDERHVAETLQEALLLLPETLPGVEIANLYRSATDAAQVGGDFYDVFESEPGSIGIVIGDISGKDIEAATQITQVKSTIRAFTFHGDPPEIVLQKTNGVLERTLAPHEFVSLFYAIFSPASGRLIYCNAGHPPALVRRGSGLDRLEPTAPVLGAFPEGGFGGARRCFSAMRGLSFTRTASSKRAVARRPSA